MKKGIIRKSITLKLFISTAIFFIIFITAQLVLQSFFFQSFYTSKKVNTLKNNLEFLERKYRITFKNAEGSIAVIKKFEENNNAKVVVLENNGLLSYITDTKEELKDSNKIRIIKAIIEEWTSNPDAFKNLQEKGKTITYIFNDPYYNLKHIVAIDPVVINNNVGKVLFAVSSLQPVDEAVKVMKEFFIYTYIIAIILILVLSTIYSKMISKPLIKLNKTALKMAKLDFDEICEGNTEDEIGNLGNTLNFLSRNLKEALSSLQESNKKLKKDIEKEKELESMRKEFVASVSHELKTPISLIEGYAEGIKDDIMDEEDKEYYIDVIIDEARNMGVLVADMLELSRLESGTQKINIKPFIIDDIINNEVKKLNKINEDKNNEDKINILVDLQKEVVVLGDEDKIHQVITNFLTNAIKYTKPKGKIYITSKIYKDKLLVEVENEGENIKDEELTKIWDKFYKLDKSRNRSLGGTGLGLAIVKNILKLHNSEYGVCNTNRGVKFFFTLNKKKE
ncbi:HAMP domain-containing protein [Clostridium botulinum C]|uniref:HAMP domain-containing sensor histidine kinase n=1 Tax=Clostridium botulinum TaxID=1491 RepID=UPI001E59C2A8|nr:HAMP domain-containing sensor histidine kinase [Clostridium botulinum]MCD3217525.1 HAMP domain-containing protein [Clostridium botulinum C]